ncbi:hypothetical protein RFI_34478 [Reticulomyxa filosa]|uniref:Uncharacterized protein n=1 Tax=Reticulomyxa filosa TaxID=46433 RepID=X6LQD8_RETFI|nr:hypothetical protein RFI_34478 [Reticulomyxa filosa]|eukprot:ETO02935.1 hypothetical protein RFI_34478 [Reticulomyxa filosa]
MKLNKKQLDDVFESISTKLNDKQLDRVFSAFLHGLKDIYNWVRVSCARSLGIIAIKASEKQLEKVVNALMSGLKDGDNDVRYSYAESLGVISTSLTDKQLENAINTLIDGLKDKYKHFIIHVQNHLERLVELLELISTKLNDKQLYLLVIHFLEKAKKGCEWVEELKHKCSDLIDDWSCNVVHRLLNLKLMSSNSYCEMSLVVGHKDHCIYLSLCKTLDYVLVRVDNRWMKTIPLNKPIQSMKMD